MEKYYIKITKKHPDGSKTFVLQEIHQHTIDEKKALNEKRKAKALINKEKKKYTYYEDVKYLKMPYTQADSKGKSIEWTDVAIAARKTNAAIQFRLNKTDALTKKEESKLTFKDRLELRIKERELAMQKRKYQSPVKDIKNPKPDSYYKTYNESQYAKTNRLQIAPVFSKEGITIPATQDGKYIYINNASEIPIKSKQLLNTHKDAIGIAVKSNNGYSYYPLSHYQNAA